MEKANTSRVKAQGKKITCWIEFNNSLERGQTSTCSSTWGSGSIRATRGKANGIIWCKNDIKSYKALIPYSFYDGKIEDSAHL